jgi:hypothetical protein
VGATGTLLTPQAAIENGPGWDALQTTAAADAVVYAVQGVDGADRVTIKPAGLRAQATYRVVSVDQGVLGEASGAALMSQGVELRTSPNTAAHMVTFVLQP